MKAVSKYRSYAVMAQRNSGAGGFDYFPTPPWATRALMEHVILKRNNIEGMTCFEPACGGGHMAVVLREYFKSVDAADIQDHGFGEVKDYLASVPEKPYDWIITNPPFNRAGEFVIMALRQARHGVAILARTVFLESVGRYNGIFKDNPPTVFAQFVERVPMVKGRLSKSASTATGYGWFIWEKDIAVPTMLTWIPPCRKKLERDSDYY